MTKSYNGYNFLLCKVRSGSWYIIGLLAKDLAGGVRLYARDDWAGPCRRKLNDIETESLVPGLGNRFR